MDFAPDASTVEIVARMQAFLTECVYPAESVLERQVAETPDDWSLRPIVRALQVGEAHCGQEQVPEAARLGLSLQLPHDATQTPVIRSLRNLALEHGLGGVDALGEEGLHPRDDLYGGGIRGEVHQ